MSIVIIQAISVQLLALGAPGFRSNRAYHQIRGVRDPCETQSGVHMIISNPDLNILQGSAVTEDFESIMYLKTHMSLGGTTPGTEIEPPKRTSTTWEVVVDHHWQILSRRVDTGEGR